MIGRFLLAVVFVSLLRFWVAWVVFVVLVILFRLWLFWSDRVLRVFCW